MATKTVLSLVASFALVVSGCGGGDKAGAKQAALAPASVQGIEEPETTPAKPVTPPAKAVAAKSVPTKAVAPAESASVAVVAPDSAAAPAHADSSDIRDRESFSYAGGSRDPFVSLLANTKVGPELPDLVLVAIYYDTRNPGASVVMMREKIGGKKYSLRPGDRLGRMRVATIRPKDVTFAIDDFGSERQETVSLRKQEEIR